MYLQVYHINVQLITLLMEFYLYTLTHKPQYARSLTVSLSLPLYNQSETVNADWLR